MSWDVHILRLDRHVRSLGELPKDYVPPILGMGVEVRAAITELFPGTDWTDPSWGIFQDGSLAIEFALGHEEPVPSFGVLVHGDGDPVPPILQLCTANGWAAIDVQSSEVLDPRYPEVSSWLRYCEWRDRAMKG